MSILITGGAGFIGSHMLDWLLKSTNEQLICLDNFNDYYDPARKRANIAHLFGHERLTFVRGDFCETKDLLDIASNHDVRRILHLGGYPGVRYSVENPLVYQQVNIMGTTSVLEVARELNVERLVVVSSSTVYGAGAQAPFVEDAPLGVPLSPYGASKRAAEVNAFTWHLTYQVPVVCVRLFSVYGPRLRPDLAMSIFSDCMLRGAPITLYGDGSVLRDFTHVSDICRGLQATLFTPGIEGEAFNLGHNEPIAMRDVIRQLEAGLACRAVIQRRASRAEDMPLTHADLTKSQRLLGYQPTVSFNAGCLDFCRWYASTFGHRTKRLAA